MADETAWLIERADGDREGPRYLMGIRQGYGPMWHTDPNEAVRFSRDIDAKRIAVDLEAPQKVVEHVWHDAPRRDITDGAGRRDIFKSPHAK